jgi:hypothetical protein
MDLDSQSRDAPMCLNWTDMEAGSMNMETTIIQKAARANLHLILMMIIALKTLIATIIIVIEDTSQMRKTSSRNSLVDPKTLKMTMSLKIYII